MGDDLGGPGPAIALALLIGLLFTFGVCLKLLLVAFSVAMVAVQS